MKRTVRTPTVRTPTVRTPTVRAPTVRAPTVRIPTVRAPTVRAPTVRIPTIRVPTVRIPTIRAPTVRAPTTVRDDGEFDFMALPPELQRIIIDNMGLIELLTLSHTGADIPLDYINNLIYIKLAGLNDAEGYFSNRYKFLKELNNEQLEALYHRKLDPVLGIPLYQYIGFIEEDFPGDYDYKMELIDEAMEMYSEMAVLDNNKEFLKFLMQYHTADTAIYKAIETGNVEMLDYIIQLRPSIIYSLIRNTNLKVSDPNVINYLRQITFEGNVNPLQL